MMVNCPKCGFSQPQDQYCANCGVDMIAFRPVEKPLLARLLTSPWFQVSLFIFVSFGAFTIMRNQNAKQLAARVAQIENAGNQIVVQQTVQAADVASQADNQASSLSTPIPAESSAASEERADPSELGTLTNSNATATGPTKPLPSESAPPPPPPPLGALGRAADSSADQASANPSAVGASGPASKTSASEQNAAHATSTKLVFAEVNKAFLSELFTEGKTSSFGSITVAVTPSLETKIKSAESAGAWIPTESADSQKLRINQPIMTFKGMRDDLTRQNLGFTVQITPTSQDENGTHLQVEVLRVLRDSSASPPIEDVSIPIPEYIVVPRGGGLLISGLLPRKILSEADERLYRSSGVLRVLTSDAFRSGASELVLYIETK